MWEWKDFFFLTCPLFDFDFELRFSWSSERRWESGGIGSKAVKKCRYNADPTLGVLYGKSIYTFLHFYTSTRLKTKTIRRHSTRFCTFYTVKNPSAYFVVENGIILAYK